MPDVTDPWGTVTIVVPHLKMESIHALSRLLYCGNSGNLSNVIMEEILNYVRPEFGGFKQNQKPISKPLKDPVSNEITKKSSKLQEKPATSLNQNSSSTTQMNKPAENTQSKAPPITEPSVKSNTQMPINQLLKQLTPFDPSITEVKNSSISISRSETNKQDPSATNSSPEIVKRPMPEDPLNTTTVPDIQDQRQSSLGMQTESHENDDFLVEYNVNGPEPEPEFVDCQNLDSTTAQNTEPNENLVDLTVEEPPEKPAPEIGQTASTKDLVKAFIETYKPVLNQMKTTRFIMDEELTILDLVANFNSKHKPTLNGRVIDGEFMTKQLASMNVQLVGPWQKVTAHIESYKPVLNSRTGYVKPSDYSKERYIMDESVTHLEMVANFKYKHYPKVIDVPYLMKVLQFVNVQLISAWRQVVAHIENYKPGPATNH